MTWLLHAILLTGWVVLFLTEGRYLHTTWRLNNEAGRLLDELRAEGERDVQRRVRLAAIATAMAAEHKLVYGTREWVEAHNVTQQAVIAWSEYLHAES